MIQHLLNISDYVHIYREIRKLPAIYGYSKNLRRDGSPRYLAWHVIKKGNHYYSLVEVDTTDNPNSLSTLLIKHKNISLNSQKYIGELEKQLIKQSLVWPTHFLTRTLENNYKRISHPKSPAENQGLLNRESIKKWAERVSLEMVD